MGGEDGFGQQHDRMQDRLDSVAPAIGPGRALASAAGFRYHPRPYPARPAGGKGA